MEEQGSALHSETKPRAPARPEDPGDGGGQPGPEVPSVPLVSLLRGKNPNLSLAHPRDWQGPGPHCHPGVSTPREQAAHL